MEDTIDIQSNPDLINSCFQGDKTGIYLDEDHSLPDDMAISAIKRACDFFHLPYVPVIHSNGSCVWPNDPNTTIDDVLGFDRNELINLGIVGEDSLTLIYTHECAHRALQSYQNLDPWEHELACDFYAGVHAGLHGIDTENIELALGKTHGSYSHPEGILRADFIKYGEQVAHEMSARHIPLTFEGCLERFNQHLIEKEDMIEQCRANANYLIPPHKGEHPLGLIKDESWHRQDHIHPQHETEKIPRDYLGMKEYMEKKTFDSKEKTI